MQANAEQRVISVLARRSGIAQDKISKGHRLVQDLNLDGDDAIDAILEISKACSMEICDFDSGQYFKNEPNIFSIFKKDTAPKREITVRELVHAAQQGYLSSM